MKRYSLLLVALLLLLFISQCLGLVSSSKNINSYGEVTYLSPSLGWLHTEGRWIKDAGGRTVILRGAAWVNTCCQRSHGWLRHDMTVADIDLYKSCGANVLLVPLNKKAWQTEPEYVAEIDNIVNLCEQKGIYVILHFYDNHLIDAEPEWGIAERWATLTNPAAVQEIIDWEKVVATRYKTRSHVVGFGDINEPIVDPSDPVYSGYTRDQVLQTLRNFHIQAIRALHSVNPNLLIFVQGHNWANDLRDYISNPLTETNVVYQYHHYYHYALQWPEEYAAAYRDGDFVRGKALYEEFTKERGLNIALLQNKPFFYSEFNIFGPPEEDPNGQQWLWDHFETMRKHDCGWTFWGFAATQPPWEYLWILKSDWKTLSFSGVLWRNELLT